MNSQSFNSKKYALAFFMSTCLLASSFLSTSARAATFTELANKTPALSSLSEVQRKNEWNKYSLVTKQAAWKAAKLVPDLNQAILDVQNGFDPKLLSDSNTKVRHKAREKNAEITLYIAQIEQSHYYREFNNYINLGETPTPEEVGLSLGIDYDPRKTNDQIEKDQNVRRAEKDKKAIIDRYVDLVKIALEGKEYITTGRVPELEELKKNSNIDDAKAKYYRTMIRDQVMDNKKEELIKLGKIPTQEELNKLFGKDREANDTKYTEIIRSSVMHNKKHNYVDTNYTPNTQEIMTEFNVDKGRANLYLKQIKDEMAKKLQDEHNQSTNKSFTKYSRTTTSTTGTSPGIPFYTGRTKQENKSHGFSFKDIFTKVKNNKQIKNAISVQNLSQAIKREEYIQDFKNSMQEKNYFAALNIAKGKNLDSAYTQEAVNGIVSNLDPNTIKSILFANANATNASNKFDLSRSIIKDSIVTEILSNISEAQRVEFITELSKYANKNLIPLISKDGLQGQAALEFTKLATIINTAPVKKLLHAQLEVKNILRINNLKDSDIQNLSPTIARLIGRKLYELEITTTDSLTRGQIINLVKNWNQQTLDNNINILTSDLDLLKTEITEKFTLTKQNNSGTNTNKQQGNVPPPPPPFGNVPPLPPVNFTNNTNSGIDLDKLKASYPDLHSSYNDWIKHNQQKPKTTTNNTTTATTTAGDSQIEYGPLTEYSQLYKDYRENANNKSDQPITESLRQKESVINTIRQVVTASHATKGSDIEALITLFDNQDQKIQEEAMKVFDAFKENPDLKNVTKSMSTKYVKGKLFGEDKDEAIKRISYPSSQISELQKAAIQEYANKLEYATQLNKITDPLEKLRFAHDNNMLNTHVSELINTAHTLPYKEQIRVLEFLNKNPNDLEAQDKKLKGEISISEQQNIKNSVLSVLEIKYVAQDQQLDARSLLFTIKDKDPKLLEKLLEAKVIWEESKTTKSEFSALRTELENIIPFINNMNDADLRQFLNKITIPGIEAAFKESLTAANTTIPPHQYTGSVPPPPRVGAAPPPPPPPPPGAGFTNSTSASSIFTQMKIDPKLTERIKQLPKSKARVIKTSQTNNTPIFNSTIAQKCHDAFTKHDPSKIGLSNEEKLKDTIHEEVFTQYFESIENTKSNILKTLDKNEKVKQEVLTSLEPGFIGPKTEIADTLYKFDHPNLKELKEAFNTAHSDYTDDRTELGQVIYALYAGQYLALLNDTEFMKLIDEESVLKNADKQVLQDLVVELKAKQSKLEEASNTHNQSESSNNTDLIKKVTAILKLASKDHDFDKDNQEELLPDNTTSESSDKTDESDDKKLSALSSIHGQGIDESDDKKLLPALSSSDEEDKGYETDEEELEESSTATEEELKKDIPLENADEAIDMLLETEEAAEQAAHRQQLSDEAIRKAALLNATSTLHKHVHPSILTNRLNIGAAAAGDEEITINRGVWISGLYGINKQGAWKNIPKYQGRTAGVTIGVDAEFVNSHDVIGIAYSRLESQVKYNKKLGKTAINGHLFSIYGLKELIKGFSLQAITSYGHNYIKNKTTSINNIIGKYQNNNVSFETLLNYKYRTKYDLHFIPSIGLKYDYSRASNYKEYEVDIENLMIQKKSNQSFESSLGGKIVFKPIRIINNITLTPSLHGNIEHHFNNKNTKVNAKATFKGQILEETIILPKQPKLGYNIGSNILMSRKNINVLLEYNYYTHKKYQSHQGLVKLKVNL